MRLLLVGGFRHDKEERESLESLHKYMVQTLPDDLIESVYLSDIVYTLAEGLFEARVDEGSVNIADYDAVYIRGPKMRMRSDQAYYLSRFCEYNNIRCVNDYSLYYPGTKIAQGIMFIEEGAKIPKTLYTLDNETLVNRAEKELGYPYILKGTSGSHGDANYLITSRDEANTALSDNVQVDFLVQEFCPNDRDFRILVTKDDALIFARKGSVDTHLNNTSKGAQAELVPPSDFPVDIIQKSKRVAERLRLEIAGVDVMPNKDTGELYFLEINSQPQLVTGALLEEKAKLVRSLFDHK